MLIVIDYLNIRNVPCKNKFDDGMISDGKTGESSKVHLRDLIQ